jgi:aspartate 1-decarboxylase
LIIFFSFCISGRHFPHEFNDPFSRSVFLNRSQKRFARQRSFGYHINIETMLIEMLKSKVHHAVITEANLGYVGSLTLDQELMEAARMIEHEKIQVVNGNNGERIETYLIKGKRGSGICCLNGPAARKGAVGDVVIILSYASMTVSEAKDFQPIVVFPKKNNLL